MVKISKVSGLIAAASKKVALPMIQIGSIPIIKRIVLMFMQAGIFPIVVITGANEEEVRYSLSGSGVIFLHNENNEDPELFESVKIGLSYLKNKCDKIIFTPVNVPMFSPNTLKTLIDTEGDIITPSYKKKGGHPILISENTIPEILNYKGENGLRGAISSIECEHIHVDVNDEGILYSIHNYDNLIQHVNYHNEEILHPVISLSLEKESTFFNQNGKLLLFLISDTHSVSAACKLMSLSLSKGWNILNKLEKEIDCLLIERKHGGNHGGKTELTKAGYNFLKAYQVFEENIFKCVSEQFEIFLKDSSVF